MFIVHVTCGLAADEIAAGQARGVPVSGETCLQYLTNTVDDLERPDFGDSPRMAADELPLFWACGVTPQVAIEAARPSICITHKPGSMLITDKKNAALAAL